MKPQLVADYVETGKIKFEYRDMAFLGAESNRAAEAAACALDQGEYWQYHETIFLNHDGVNQGAYSNGNLKAMAEGIGLDMDQFNSCFDGNEHEDEITAMTSEARAAGVSRTPSFVINGQLVEYQGYDALRGAIEAALLNP